MAKANLQSFYRTFLWVSFLVFVVSLESVAKQGKFDADGKNSKVNIARNPERACAIHVEIIIKIPKTKQRRNI